MQLTSTSPSSPSNFRSGSTDPVRDMLIGQTLPLVRALASKFARSRSCQGLFSFDELVAAGFLGLVQAANSFDHRPGVQFATFAYHRIRGAMIESVREDAKWLARFGQATDPSAVFADVDEEHQSVGGRGDRFEEGSALAIEDAVDCRRALLRLRQALVNLTDRQRQIVERLYRDHDGSFSGLAQELGTDRSTVWRAHHKAIARLRSHLGATPSQRACSIGQSARLGFPDNN